MATPVRNGSGRCAQLHTCNLYLYRHCIPLGRRRDTLPGNDRGHDFSQELQDAGFRNGDRLVSLNGRPLDATDYSMQWDLLQPGAEVGVIREGKETVVTVSDMLIRQIATKGKDYVPMSVRVPVYVAKAMPGEPAAEAGIAPGDHITALDGRRVASITEFIPMLAEYKGKTIIASLERPGRADTTVNLAVNEAGKIGIQMLSPYEIFDRQKIHYNLLESIPRGWEIGTDRLSSYVSSLKLVFTKEGAQSLGGFGTLGDLFPNQWNWYSFWQITAFLSIILAFMNIIPIPGLDGGHTLFLLVEMVTRRKPSDKFLEVANTCGFFLLLLLLVYANGNDIYRYFLK